MIREGHGRISPSGPIGWRIHRLSEFAGQWRCRGLRNWRINFEEEDGIVSRLNLEDYH